MEERKNKIIAIIIVVAVIILLMMIPLPGEPPKSLLQVIINSIGSVLDDLIVWFSRLFW